MTPLLKRIIQENRALFGPLLLGLLLNVMAYIFLVGPRGTQAAGAADRATAATISRIAAERELASAKELVTGKARADEELRQFYDKVLPTTRESARRMMDERLPALADDTDVRLLKKNAEDAADSQDARLGQLVVSMVLQGEYNDLRDFLYAVESAQEFIVVDDVVLSEGRGDEPLSLSVRMSTYYRKPNGA